MAENQWVSIMVFFSPLFVWRTFEKKSYRIGPSLPRSSSHALVLEGVTLDPPQLKAQPGLARSHKGMFARLGKPIDVTFPSKTLIYMRCFFILHASMINLHFREMFYIFYIVYVYCC